MSITKTSILAGMDQHEFRAPSENENGQGSESQPVSLGWDTSKGPVHGHAVSNMIAGLPPQTPDMPEAVSMGSFGAQQPQFSPPPPLIPPSQGVVNQVGGTQMDEEEDGIGTNPMKIGSVKSPIERKEMIKRAILELIGKVT